jgi:3-hydroxybutyryl-CoA dehydrogenase
MGQGLARLFVKHGLQTILYEPVQDALVAAEKKLQAFQSDNWQSHSAGESKGQLRFTSELQEAASEADLIIECVPEDLTIKKMLYSKLGPLVKPDAIVASNTSSFPLSTLSDGQFLAARLIIAHFFNSPDIIPLVEIVKSENTSPGVVERIAGFLSQCGKVPVILKKDIPGFVANRLQAAVLREACFLVQNNIVDAAQVDTVVTESIGMRWAFSGPFQVADYGGLDIWEKVLDNLLPHLSNDSEVPLIVQEKVKQKLLGLKSGKGFYSYDAADASEQSKDRERKLQKLLHIRRTDE